MSTPTTNYGLIKAADGEPYDVDITNNNLDSIDAELKKSVKVGKPFGHMGRTAGFANASAAGAIVQMAAAQDLRGGMAFDAPSSSLVIPVAGWYRIFCRPYISGGSGYSASGKCQRNLTDISGAYTNTWKGDSSDYPWVNSWAKQLNAGDKINLICMSAGGLGSYWGTDGYNGAYVEVEWMDS